MAQTASDLLEIHAAILADQGWVAGAEKSCIQFDSFRPLRFLKPRRSGLEQMIIRFISVLIDCGGSCTFPSDLSVLINYLHVFSKEIFSRLLRCLRQQMFGCQQALHRTGGKS